jgi:hypothetical protein
MPSDESPFGESGVHGRALRKIDRRADQILLNCRHAQLEHTDEMNYPGGPRRRPAVP